MHLAHDILLNVQFEHAVMRRYLRTRMELNTGRAHVLLTLHTLGRGISLPIIDNFTNVTVRYLRRLPRQHQLLQVADEKVVGELAAPA